jgi:tetratricopeptide (TPR) repeat protein
MRVISDEYSKIMRRNSWLVGVATIGAIVTISQVVPQIRKSIPIVSDANRGLISILRDIGSYVLQKGVRTFGSFSISPESPIRTSVNTSVNASNASDYVTQGNTSIAQGDDQGALASFNQAIATDAKLLDAYYHRAKLKAEKLQDKAGAIADCDQMIALEPQNTWAYSNRGYMKVEYTTDFQGALADYNKSIALDPKYTFAYNSRAYLKSTKLNDVAGGLADYNKSIEIDPKDVFAYNARAYLKEQKLQDFKGALADYNQAIALNPKSADAYSSRANLQYQGFQDTLSGIADYSKLIELNPSAVINYYNRGDLLYGMGDKVGALQDFQKVLLLDNTGKLGTVASGIIQLEKKSFDRAIADFDLAVQLDAQSPDIYKYRGLAHQQKGNKPSTLQDWRKAAQLYQKSKQVADYKLVQKWLQDLGETTPQ